MNVIKKEITELGNVLLNSGNELIILDSFASRYVLLKKSNKKCCEEFRILYNFFDTLGIFPFFDEKNGEMKYIKKEDILKSREKRKNKNLKKENIGEKELIGDILFDFKNEIEKLIINLYY